MQGTMRRDGMYVASTILYNIFIAIYESAGFALCLAFLFMFFFMCAKKNGWKESLKIWVDNFKTSGEFRKAFVFVFYISMVLFRTLFNRQIWINPLRDIMGGWSFYSSEGKLSGENIENIALLIPFPMLLFWCQGAEQFKSLGVYRIIIKGIFVTFTFSAIIEFSQLFFSLGTFQISDFVYNTFGGMCGSIFYCFFIKMHTKKLKNKGD